MSNLNYHFYEIKSRFFYLFFSTFCTFLIIYHYKIEIVYIIGKPFVTLQQTFIFLELTEAFYTLLKVSLMITALLVIPLFFYQFWSFFIPSFYQLERRKVNFFFFSFICLWFCEILVTYFIFLPKICNFLISFEMVSDFQNSGLFLQPMISVEFSARFESYVKLIMKISSLLFLFFQIPLCVCLLYYSKILNVSIFYTNRKILSIISLLMSAFVVPPDVLSQIILAVLIYVVFEFLIFLGLFF